MVKKVVEDLIRKLEALHIQTEQALEQLRQEVRSDEVSTAPTPTPTTATGGFRIGDRVLITNKISHALRGAPGSNTDRIGIVKKVTAERVFFVTLAGTHTCRAPKNLRLIEAPVNGLYF
jgi:hypothetical protein